MNFTFPVRGPFEALLGVLTGRSSNGWMTGGGFLTLFGPLGTGNVGKEQVREKVNNCYICRRLYKDRVLVFGNRMKE